MLQIRNGRSQPRHDSSGRYNETLESSLDRPSLATRSQFGHRRRSVGGGGGGSHRQISLLSTQLQKHPSTTARQEEEPRRGSGGGITASRSADGFGSIIWSLLLAFKHDVPSLTDRERLQDGEVHFSHDAMRVTFSTP